MSEILIKEENKETMFDKKQKLQELREYQNESKLLLNKVNKRITELEENYLSETTLGNIVRGFDIDGKNQRLKSWDDKEQSFKEKLFSCSSYEIWLESKANLENEKLLSKSDINGNNLRNSFKNNKRIKKNSINKKDDDWNQVGDY